MKANLDDLSKRNADAADPAKGTLDGRISDVQADLEKATARQGELSQELSQLETALKAIGEHAASLSDEQRKQAGNLRDMQLQMLGKAEEYENTRREQASELVNLTALLAGQRDEKQNIELAVRSLNLSVSALKRTKEIVEEMAFFFKSFSDFMQVILDQATDQVSSYESAGPAIAHGCVPIAWPSWSALPTNSLSARQDSGWRLAWYRTDLPRPSRMAGANSTSCQARTLLARSCQRIWTRHLSP
ncbi:MAG: hypothetical protein EOP15_02615 [Pseudomonas sp.]|nr:MAG: hypothetical protein EOP15_02615 [Pseudomonas sp.]